MNRLFKRRETVEFNLERLFATLFILFGAVYWGAMTLHRGFDSIGIFMITLLVLLGAYFYEWLTSLALMLMAVLVIIFGLFAKWEPGVWMIMTIFFISPPVFAAVLLAFAARTQEYLEERNK